MLEANNKLHLNIYTNMLVINQVWVSIIIAVMCWSIKWLMKMNLVLITYFVWKVEGSNSWNREFQRKWERKTVCIYVVVS